MSTIVLVGGAFLGAWAWERVTPGLTGHDVYPLTLTGFGDRAHLGAPETDLTTHATDIVNAIEYADLRDVVLVAHSYGGAPATVAASRIADRIARIVYVAAVLPEPGKSLFEITPPMMEQLMQQSADEGGDGWRIPVLSDEILDTYFGRHDLATDDRAWLRARGVAQPIAGWREPAPVDLTAVEKLPRTYIACDGDPGEPPSLPCVDPVTIHSGHWPMITAPAILAATIAAVS
jgi:pimeloyl-ACP methyl ester carboxylesterase